MKKVLVCKTTEFRPSFFVSSKGDDDGEWVTFDPDNLDDKELKKVSTHLGITPKALSAFIGVIEDLRSDVEEDVNDLYKMIEP